MSKKYADTVLLAHDDQRVCRGPMGHFYIFDQSGHCPDNTDDGPLRIDRSQSLVVGEKLAYVSVFVEREGERHGTVGMSHEAALKLQEVLNGYGQGLSIRCEISKTLQKLILMSFNKVIV